ncbi:TonB-dependent receptor [Synoicihabitans lomoniglobus]|uniref:TonB-dependent receptor plug domain-containing protein n=1 Tax=Synoicihabitans lomoniglobus TaxID=2909285 RepID=A0AAF0CMY2_9BACT|nr:TonB-dependent receptor plug domain-containing protein [Opitutaceae bacterium LMO-M01]WED63936.1 TonB-dependent receptor plug domain-containing protein [Opitutaceae bacterium LMO-M01]
MNYYKRALALTASAALAATPAFAQTATSEETVQLDAFVVTEMSDFADQAVLGTTPVAFTSFDKEKITKELGSRDIPLVLNSAPSIYATEDSGGAGDARVNVRGFSQRNVAIMINGVPTNDMENGWLYWSNWDALGDVSQSIQLQRGLSNTSLPMPSIGGTLNIITDPSASERGASVKFEAGSDSFYKVTGVFNTGILEDKFALTVAALHKEGDGKFDQGWTKGEGYYLGATWFVNDTNRLELYGIASPQQHGQRFDANIASWSIKEAKKLGYTDAQIAAVNAYHGSPRFYGSGPLDAGFDFNSNAAPVNPSYTGQQFYWGGLNNRYDANFMNERVNYFNKPQFNLNWFSEISDTMKLASVFYWSGGEGGGSGTYGSLKRYGYDSPYSQNYDWNATIADNQSQTPDANGEIGSRGILRNSNNEQNTYGIISKLTYDVSEEISLNAGVDWRTAEVDHYREVRDLLGGDYYLYTGNDFDTTPESQKKRLGDKLAYYNTNTIDWLGLFVTSKYKSGPIDAFGTIGYSSIDYSYLDHFTDVGGGQELYAEANGLDGSQIKGGISYEFTEQFSAFVNAGWVDRAPIFDGAIDDVTGNLVPDPTNETYTSFEIGARWATPSENFWIAANAYFTTWRDLTGTDVDEQADIVTYQRGINSDYNGIEIEAAYQANDWIRFDAAASFGDWTYVSDVAYTQYSISTRTELPSTGDKLYLDGIKVGDQPQTQLAYAVTVFPTDGLSIKLLGRSYSNYYADWDVFTRTDSSDRGQSWKIPSYTVFDLHVNYDLPMDFGPADVSLFAHVFNVLDETYIADASDNSQYEGLPAGLAGVQSHSAQSAAVFFGQKLNWNIGARLRF